MVDQLRRFLNRPLHDSERWRLFAIRRRRHMAVAAVLALLDDAGLSPRPSGAATRAADPVALAEPVAVTRAAAGDPHAPGEESNPPTGMQGSRSDIARSKRAARRFLAGYLPYT
jgi:hypothetical protein